MTTTQHTATRLQDVGFHYDTVVGDCGGWARRGMVGGVVVDDLIFREGVIGSMDEPWNGRFGYFWCRERLDDGAVIEGRWFPTHDAAVRFALMVAVCWTDWRDIDPAVTEGR